MSALTYLDFDLAIDHEGEGYRARVLHSPAGQAQVLFQKPLTDEQLENFYLRVGRTRSGVRRIDSSEMQAAKRVGSQLFSAVFKDELYASLRSSLVAAQSQGKGLRLRLRIAAPDLQEMPWEYLYIPYQDMFLSLSVETPVLRYQDLAQSAEALVVRPPLRVLVMIASPHDLPSLDVAQEWQRLAAAMDPVVRNGLVTLERVQPATLEALQRRLRQGDWHIFHFMGHGRFDPQTQDGVLLLENELGRGVAVSGTYLGPFLRDHKPLRLVVLNACEGARASRSDPFAGVAQGLVRHGIPAVIAMQFEITDRAAITFTQELYSAIADGYPVDGALAEARKAIFAQGNDIEWGTPVLFTRSPDGQIFHVVADKAAPKASASPPNASQLDKLYEQGLSAYLMGNWEQALASFEQIAAVRPNYEDVAAKLTETRAKLNRPEPVSAEQLATLYRNGLRAMNQGHWQEARDLLGQVVAAAPAYSNAADLLGVIEARLMASQPKPQSPPVFAHLPSAICLETQGGVATALLAEGTFLPASDTVRFSTAADHQTSVEVHLGYGTRPMMNENISLGKFLLDGIPPAPRGVPQIEISIAVDEHLQLQVKAQDLATGHSKSFNRIDLIPLALSTGGESTTLPTGRETAVPLAEDGASSTAASDSGDKKADQNAGPDASGFDWSQWTTGGPGGPRANVHYGDIDDLLGEGSFSKIFGNAFSGRAQRKPRTQAVEHSLTISLEEAALGTERVLAIDQGDGQQKRLTARIPGGVRTGSKVRFSGAFGETGQDLYLVITVADHPLYQRSGDDLLLEYPLAQKRGPFGRSIQVPLLEGGKASTPLPAKISAGMEVKVAGKGACKLRTEGRGDLRVILQPYDPSAVRPEMLEQVKRIKAALGR